MAEESGQEKTLEASARKLQQARERGDLPISREGSSFGLYAAMLLILWLVLVAVSAEFVWLAFVLWLLAGHLLPLGWGLAFSAVVLVVTAG